MLRLSEEENFKMETLIKADQDKCNVGWSIFWFLFLVLLAYPITTAMATFWILMSPLAVISGNEKFKNVCDFAYVHIQIPQFATEGMITGAPFQLITNCPAITVTVKQE